MILQEEDYLDHRTWAVAQDDGWVELVSGTVEDALRVAQRYGSPALDAYGDREPDLCAAALVSEEAPRLVANPPRKYRNLARASLDSTGMKPVSLAAMLKRYPFAEDGSFFGEGFEAAWEVLKPIFPTFKMLEGKRTDVELWQDPYKAIGINPNTGALEAKGLLGSNFKLEKEATLPDGRRAIARGLSLLPNHLAYELSDLGHGTLCALSTTQCRSLCLAYAGQNMASPYNEGVKLSKTTALLRYPMEFCRVLLAAVYAFSCSQPCIGRAAFVRLNVYSDLPWELLFPGLFESLPEVSFYDYTKVPGRVIPDNYHLTFSYSGTDANIEHSRYEVEKAGRNLAVVFMLKRNDTRFPKTFTLDDSLTLPVIDGTLNDVRPLDPQGVVVGLRYIPPKRARAQEALAGDRSRFVRKLELVENPDPRPIAWVVPVVVNDDGSVLVPETPRATNVRRPGLDVD